MGTTGFVSPTVTPTWCLIPRHNVPGSLHLGHPASARNAKRPRRLRWSGWRTFAMSSAAREGLHSGWGGHEHRGPLLRAPEAQALVHDSALQRAAGPTLLPVLPEQRGSAHPAENWSGTRDPRRTRLSAPAELGPGGRLAFQTRAYDASALTTTEAAQFALSAFWMKLQNCWRQATGVEYELTELTFHAWIWEWSHFRSLQASAKEIGFFVLFGVTDSPFGVISRRKFSKPDPQRTKQRIAEAH